MTDLYIPDPIFYLSLFNSAVREKRVKLYPWQIEACLEFSRARKKNETIKMAVCANNGSGKSQFCVAPCAAWVSRAFQGTPVIVTSSSGRQLDKQVGQAINHLCLQENTLLGGEACVMKYRDISRKNGSRIQLFATDEEGKAEGDHQFADSAGEFAMFVDEAKSVGENIFEALTRCTGVTRRMDVSSPGAPSGHFYKAFTGGRWWTKHVSYLDCPHISKEQFEEDVEMYGLYSPLIQSMYFARFTSLNNSFVITHESIEEWYKNKEEKRFGENFAGLDLAAGGDEDVLSIWNGNTQIGLECFRFVDTMKCAAHLVSLFRKWSLRAENIWADDGNVGKSIIDRLGELNYKGIHRISNQSSARNKAMYLNKGVENWMKFAQLGSGLVFLKDKIQKTQLSSRFYTQKVNGKLQLESKAEAKAHGRPSPDRGDATVLAFVGKPLDYIKMMSETSENKSSVTSSFKREILPHQDELVEAMDRLKFQRVDRTIIDQTFAVALSSYYDDDDVKEEMSRRLNINNN